MCACVCTSGFLLKQHNETSCLGNCIPYDMVNVMSNDLNNQVKK